MAKTGTDVETVENRRANNEVPPELTGDGSEAVMRSKEDELSVWQTVQRYKFAGTIAMTAAFCASLDGYRENFHRPVQTGAGGADRLTR